MFTVFIHLKILVTAFDVDDCLKQDPDSFLLFPTGSGTAFMVYYLCLLLLLANDKRIFDSVKINGKHVDLLV